MYCNLNKYGLRITTIQEIFEPGLAGFRLTKRVIRW